MISRMARLRAKRGFTMIELLVVIAIIGILAGIMIPMVLYDNRGTQGKGVAKELFYRAQDEVLSVEASHPDAFASITGNVIYYAVLDSTGNVATDPVTHNKRVGKLDSSYNMTDFPAEITGTTDADALDKHMKVMFEQKLTDFDKMLGVLYVVVDPNFRIIGAAWTNDFSAANLKDKVLNDVCITSDGYYYSTYPIKFCDAGAVALTGIH